MEKINPDALYFTFRLEEGHSIAKPTNTSGYTWNVEPDSTATKTARYYEVKEG